ncbi:MAG: (d)CMP kinase [Oscillospiraceae bacterium]|jgi:cytidylate kinase|nr:(d)CMP kinase [Oscillospiraceae bacterium]
MKVRSVAIDGPSGAGKSTISKTVAGRLGFIYVDTGALYRVIGLRFLETGALGLDTLKLSLAFAEGEQRMYDGGRDVTEDIRKHEVSKAASDCSALPEVRAFLLGLQREMAMKSDVIMDGRDIGTVVLPDAGLKIFLTARPEDRARRRFDQLQQAGKVPPPYEQILADIKTRDHNDSSRKEAPLRQAPDAVLLDTTGNTFEQSASLVEGLIRERYGL